MARRLTEKIVCRFEPDLAASLKQTGKAIGLNQSEYIRAAVREKLVRDEMKPLVEGCEPSA